MSRASSGGWIRRHLEGWPLASWLVFACALSAALVVPRKVEPELVPPPRVDRLLQREAEALEHRRAEQAGAGLPLEVRSVGEALRRFGQVAFAGGGAANQMREQLRRLARLAEQRHGQEKMLGLRALQTKLFERALLGGAGQLETSGPEPALELRELGGTFFRTGSEHGWFPPGPSPASAAELRSLFRVQWAESLGWERRQPYAPSLNEWRVYYRFLLSRPIPVGADRDRDLRRKLGYVAALAQHDRDYPAHLAEGVLLYQAGAYAESAVKLRQHIEQEPDGPWALRVRNYLAACGAALQE
jgi:hypothetical protein